MASNDAEVEASKEKGSWKEADFEEAIQLTGFGFYNIFILLGAFFVLMIAVFDTTAISYILPKAECDLKLTMMDKGYINAIPYAGMILAGFPCGYISDAFGRKKILLFSSLLHALSMVCLGLSQTVFQLIFFKFWGGVFMSGPFAAIMTYVMETHSKQYREYTMMIVGCMITISQLLLPVMGLFMLTGTWYYQFGSLTVKPWNVYLGATSIPSFLAAFMFTILPESPKFLMSINQSEQALNVMRKIYAVNKFTSPSLFPVQHLKTDEKDKECTESTIDIESVYTTSRNSDKETSTWEQIREGFVNLKPMFHKPYLSLALQIFALNFCIMLGTNTLRLWLPQLFASINEYQQISLEDSTDMCTILEYSLNKSQTVLDFESDDCEVFFTASTYNNNMIIAVSGFVGYVLAGTVINKIGAIRITTISLLLSSIFGFALYWSSSEQMTLILSALFYSVSSLSGTSLIGTSVGLFPTNLRTMIVALQMMIGKVGSLSGNLLFPITVALGCIPPFLLIGGTMLIGSFMSGFLPNRSGEALK